MRITTGARRTIALTMSTLAVLTATASAAGGGDLTAAHKAAVARFGPDALAVESRLDGYAREWALMPRANAGCVEPHARPKWAAFVGMVAHHMISYVTTAERGELKLYAYSRDLRGRSAKRRYVGALDKVGKGFDAQLNDGRYGIRISHMIARAQCGQAALAEATVSSDWKDDLRATRTRIAALLLAWGT
ncbi:MAG TPA: hypothetical protein VFN55_01480 [Solirubrobacteraceae bacterium]|nr:hypothetical protein [Solirubrobacteraceae bacterium]